MMVNDNKFTDIGNVEDAFCYAAAPNTATVMWGRVNKDDKADAVCLKR